MTKAGNERERQRRREDPEYRKRYNAMRAKYIRDRRKRDPEYAERLRENVRRWRRRQAKQRASKASPSAFSQPDDA
jgi:hypothetical protein